MSKFSCAEIGAALIIIFIFLLLTISFPISAGQELVLSCFEGESENCKGSGLEKIEIQNWQNSGEYSYVLRIENGGREICQPSIELQSDHVNAPILENIELLIKNNQELIVKNNLAHFFNSSTPLPDLLPKHNGFYRLIFSFRELEEEVNIPFDLIINLDCAFPDSLEIVGEVLGDKTSKIREDKLKEEEVKDEVESSINYHPMKKIAYYLKQFSIFAIFAFLFSFIFCLLKLLINSQKGGSDDKKQSKNV